MLVPDDPDVLASRAWVHQLRGDGPETIADDRAVLALAPSTHIGFDAAAEIALYEGRYADAAACFDRVIAMDPRNAMALANRGVERDALL